MINEESDTDKIIPLIYTLFCIVGIPANAVIIIGIYVRKKKD